jgi:hypothetical protein
LAIAAYFARSSFYSGERPSRSGVTAGSSGGLAPQGGDETTSPQPEATPLQSAEQIEALKRQIPSDAGEVLERFAQCIRVGGEERYDEERAGEVDEQIEKYHCATVIDDRDRVLKKYEDDPKVKAAFDDIEANF